jgi:uncharacterized protein YPO0396
LIRVRDDERDWEGAAERVLRGFALSLLVPDALYPAVSQWVDRQHLGARLVYFQVRARKARGNDPPHPQSLLRKLEIHPETPHLEWLEQSLRDRFDLACCDSTEQFRREARALTRAGQIRDPNGRHEKDDRHRIDDRSRYVLGWSNADKLRALDQQRERLEHSLAEQGASLGALANERRSLGSQLEAMLRLTEFTRFEEIDWAEAVCEIARLSDERGRLAEASDALKTLAQSLALAREALTTTERQLDGRDGVRDQRSKIEQKRSDAQHQFATATAVRDAQPVSAGLGQRIAALRAEALGDHHLTVESCDNRQQDLRRWLQDRIDNGERARARLVERIVKAMSAYRESFKTESAEFDASVEAAAEYGKRLEQLRRDDLPRFEARFKELLNVNTINEIAQFSAQLARERESIRERVALINRSLEAIDYNPGRFIVLVSQPSPDAEIREFVQDLRACTEGTLGGGEDEQYSEHKFLQVKAIIDRFRGRDGLTEADRRWTAKVTDARNAFLFSASERWRADGAEHEHYSDSGGKSGGQKEKLAYTVLAASLACQFGLERGAVRSRSFRFVVIDEAFGRGSDESAQYGLRLFEELNLQLLIVTPLQKIHVIEPHVAGVGFVHNPDGRDSRLRCLTIEDYRTQRRAALAASS